jgi:hypothetical protein
MERVHYLAPNFESKELIQMYERRVPASYIAP